VSPATHLILKPASLSIVEAKSIPEVWFTSASCLAFRPLALPNACMQRSSSSRRCVTCGDCMQPCTYDHIQSVKANKEQTKELAEQDARWTQILVNALDKVNTDTAALEHLRPDVPQIRESVCDRFLNNLMNLTRSGCWTRSRKRLSDVQSKA
jgi:hypothetical protein